MRFWSLNRSISKPLFFDDEKENTRANENAIKEAEMQEEEIIKAEEHTTKKTKLHEKEDTKTNESAAKEAEVQEEQNLQSSLNHQHV